MRIVLFATLSALAAGPVYAQDPHAMPGEEPVDPYVVSDANAGATPFEGQAMWAAFGGSAGVGRIVDQMLDLSAADTRTAGIFVATDMVRLRRTLREQFCYILNGGCSYTGRSMADAHDEIGLQPADFGTLVEHLQTAMTREGVPFRTQNRFLAKLAPMRSDTVTR